MGIYLNPGNDAFLEAIQSEIYVDKTGLIAYTNRVMGTVRHISRHIPGPSVGISYFHVF